MANDQIKISFKVFNEDFKRATSEMRADTTKLNREFRLQKEQMRLTGSETDKLKSNVGYLNQRYTQAQERVKLTKEELDKAKVAFGENSDEVKNLEGQLLNAQVQEQRFANELEIATRKLKEAENETIQYGKSLQKTGKSLEDIGGKLSSVGKSMTTKLTVPILGVAGASAKMGMALDKSMANIGTLIPGNQKRLNELKGDIQGVSIETAKSTKDISAGVYEVISAFGDSNQTMEITKINAKAAAAGLAETSDALGLSSALMKGYGDVSAESNKKVMDLAFETLKLGQTSFLELSNSMGKVIPTSNELGISQEELFTVFATGTGVTGNASEVSTQYQGVLKSLMSPTKDMTKLMGKMGYEDGQAMIAKEGLGGAIGIIVDEAKKSGVPLQKYIGSIQGQVLALALAGEQSDVYDEKLGKLKNSTGAMDAAFKEQTEGINKTGFTFEQSMIKMQVAGEKMGDALGPILANIADAVSKLADKLVALTPAQMESIAKFGLMIAAIGPVLMIFGNLFTSLGKVVGGFGGLVVSIGKAGGASALILPKLAALKAGLVIAAPIALAVAGFVGLVGILNKVRKGMKETSLESETMKGEFGENVSETTSQAVADFMELENQATTSLNELNWSGQEVSKEMAENITGNFESMKDDIVSTLEEQKTSALTSLNELYKKSKNMTEEEKDKMLQIAEEKYNGQIEKTEEGKARIKEILDAASSTNRELARTEKEEIEAIKESMKDDAIRILSESEEEQLAIMERLKAEGTEITALQSAEIVRNSVEQRDQTIATAEEEYNERLKIAANLKADGTKESKELAENIIEEAKRQRDETEKKAKEMHEGVVSQAKQQAKEHIHEVDWTTGELLSRWQTSKNEVVDTVKNMGSDIKADWELTKRELGDTWDNIKEKAKRSWNEQKTELVSKTVEVKDDIIRNWRNIGTGIYEKVEEIKGIASRGWDNVKTTASTKWRDIKSDIFKPVEEARDRVEKAVNKIKGFFSNMKLKIPKIQMPKIPKFSITGGFSLEDRTVPKISWNAKGGIFSRPTIFNTANAGLQGVGEAGQEVIAPLDTLMGYIEKAVGTGQGGNSTVNNINFNGEYQFRDEKDIDYFMNEAAMIIKRREV